MKGPVQTTWWVSMKLLTWSIIAVCYTGEEWRGERGGGRLVRWPIVEALQLSLPAALPVVFHPSEGLVCANESRRSSNSNPPSPNMPTYLDRASRAVRKHSEWGLSTASINAVLENIMSAADSYTRGRGRDIWYNYNISINSHPIIRPFLYTMFQ